MKTYAQCQDVIEKIKRAAAAAAQEVRINFSDISFIINIFTFLGYCTYTLCYTVLTLLRCGTLCIIKDICTVMYGSISAVHCTMCCTVCYLLTAEQPYRHAGVSPQCAVYAVTLTKVFLLHNLRFSCCMSAHCCDAKLCSTSLLLPLL
jgi:membrane-bound ClpP family serine protease